MRIIVVASLAYSLVNFRLTLLREMVVAGHDVIACGPEHDAEVCRALASIGVRYRRIPMRRANMNPLGDLYTLMHLVLMFRAEAPDVVLAYTQKPIIYAGLATRLIGKCRFYAMVSGLGFVFSDSNRNLHLRRLVAWLYRIAIRRARAIFVFNNDDRAEMLRYHILSSDQVVVQVPGSGVDTRRFALQPLPAGAPIFLLIARLLRDKGLVEFVEAARLVPGRCREARFQLLGPFDPNPAGIGPNEIKEWESNGIVEYLGETKDVVPYLAASTVFVLPTYYREGLPRTILEAMASGRAIITTDAPGCRETVVSGENGFLIPVRNSNALAEAMTRFVEDADLARRMGIRSREFAEQKFSVELVNNIILRAMNLRATPDCDGDQTASLDITLPDVTQPCVV